jgi:endonuclease YncB( thermonuclease family)
MKIQVLRALIALCLSAVCVFGENYEGKVVGVADGDTITILTADKTQIKVRKLKK